MWENEFDSRLVLLGCASAPLAATAAPGVRRRRAWATASQCEGRGSWRDSVCAERALPSASVCRVSRANPSAVRRRPHAAGGRRRRRRGAARGLPLAVSTPPSAGACQKHNFGRSVFFCCCSTSAALLFRLRECDANPNCAKDRKVRVRRSQCFWVWCALKPRR